MPALDLIKELESKGGLLGILKSYMNTLKSLSEEATRIWRSAFPGSLVTIDIEEIPRFYATFSAIYARARRDRRRQLEPYLKQYEDLYKRYRELIDNIRIRDLERLISDGERAYNFSKSDPRLFLLNLHRWIANLFSYFMPLKPNAEKSIPDLYKFLDKMVYVLIDVSTEYTGQKPPGAFEFILTCFIHIENFVHKSTVSIEDIGIIPVAIEYLLDLLEKLVEEHGYLVVYPGHQAGSWLTTTGIEPYTPIESDAASEAKRNILRMASQIGIDVKDNIAILKTIYDRFPAKFLIFDYYRGILRREAEAKLPWDFLGLPIETIVNEFK